MRKISFKEIDRQIKYVLEKFDVELMEKVIDLSGFLNNFGRIFLEHIDRNNIDILIGCDHIVGAESDQEFVKFIYESYYCNNQKIFDFCPECGEKLGEWNVTRIINKRYWNYS